MTSGKIGRSYLRAESIPLDVLHDGDGGAKLIEDLHVLLVERQAVILVSVVLVVAGVSRPADHGVGLAWRTAQEHGPTTVLLANRCNPLLEKGVGEGRAQFHALCLVAGCGPVPGIEGRPVGFLGKIAIQELVVLRRKPSSESAQERTQSKRAVRIAIFLDGEHDMEPASALRTSECGKSFGEPARTREEIDNGYDAPHGLRRV